MINNYFYIGRVDNFFPPLPIFIVMKYLLKKKFLFLKQLVQIS